MNRKEWLIWLMTVFLIVIASTVPFGIHWKTGDFVMSYYGTLFEHMRFFIEPVLQRFFFK